MRRLRYQILLLRLIVILYVIFMYLYVQSDAQFYTTCMNGILYDKTTNEIYVFLTHMYQN